ncbi:methyl-accepting chemotaxis protein [Priestia koreensis]|uniref:methyl-accepting chemotaxis protein n=1 Tax=Priestia koreensis TaxID=284581 RepID=UPI00203E6EF6|nr:methyl-accepting chemotaxis protein [Priestia koreensis]MCM3002487.1 methyl-accepting chemotaxis protein [Priestia koreensis]
MWEGTKRIRERSLKKLSAFPGKQQWANLNVSKKIGLVFGFIFVLIAITTLVVGVSLRSIAGETEVINEKSKRAVVITEMGSLIRAKDIRIADYITFLKEDDLKGYRADRNELNELLYKVTVDTSSANQKKWLNRIKDNNKKIDDTFISTVAPAVVRMDTAIYTSARKDISSLRDQNVATLAELRKEALKESEHAYTTSAKLQNYVMLALILSVVIILLVSVLIVTFFTSVIRHQLNNVVYTSEQIASGNLAVPQRIYESNDEIGRLTKTVQRMTDHLRETVTHLFSVSDELRGQSRGLLHSAEAVRRKSEDISGAVQELASNATVQAEHATVINETIEAFSEDVHQVAVSGKFLEKSSQHVKELTYIGSRSMNYSMNKMKQINEVVMQSYEKVQDLQKQSEEISKLVAIVKDIAAQTHLLALNATIEAARAGEFGKGFAVVANEVRKLSSQVNHAVRDITTMTATIQSVSRDTMQSLQHGYTQVEEGSTQMAETNQKFFHIEEEVENMTNRILHISTALQGLNEKGSLVRDSFQEVAATSQDFTSGTMYFSASIQEQDQEIEHMLTRITQLENHAEHLTQSVQRFTI